MTEQDKQALIKHFCFRDCGEAAKDCMIMPCHEIELIQEFPATDTGSDTISRQAAIEALDKRFDSIPMEQTTEILLLRRDLRELPPAQPEIIRCKDCKHWIPYDWMFSEVWQSKNIADYPEEDIGCNWCDMAMKANDFCSRGEKREVTT